MTTGRCSQWSNDCEASVIGNGKASRKLIKAIATRIHQLVLF